MSAGPHTPAVWLGILALLSAASAMAGLLRLAAGVRQGGGMLLGWAIMGGALAGLLLGPSVLGRVAPETYERWYAGGKQERQQRDRLVQRHGADLFAAHQAAADVDAFRAMHEQHRRELDEAVAQWRAAQWRDQATLRTFAMTITALALLCAAGFSVRQRDPRQNWLSSVSIGFWAAVVPASLAWLAARAWWGYEMHEAALLAGAVAIGPWALTASDRASADEAEHGGAHMIQRAGRVASALAVAAFFATLWHTGGGQKALYALPLLALPLGWVIRIPPIVAARVAEWLIIPALAAMVAIKIEVFDHARLWPIIIVPLLGADVRWLGAFIGAMLPGGRSMFRTAAMVIGVMSTGPTQLAIAAVALHAWAFSESLALALLLSAMLNEFTSGTRRRMANQLAEMQESPHG